MQVLVVDDELSMREYLDVLLSRAGYQVRTAGNLTEALGWLESERIDLVISDMKLKHNESGISILKAARAYPNPPEVILITAFGTPSAAVAAMRDGAYDYICKPFDNEELKLLVEKALEKRELLRENSQLRSSLHPGSGSFLLGQSSQMEQVWRLVEKVAVSRSTVLIAGESGTGKELVARAIHWKSSRSGQPFLPINCAALAEGVLESELFGHVKGAFTGAVFNRPGLLVAAGEGTVFLDEIAEMPLPTQVKLLRVLQERKVKPVGSTEEVAFEARLLAATNKRLEDEVKAGNFRQDLFYRLNVISIDLPPLRARQGDTRILANFFLERMGEELGRPNLRFSAEALQHLESYHFPGNVRQLQNIVERAATLSETDLLDPSTLPPSLRGERDSTPSTVEVALGPKFSLERYLDEAERRHLLAALEKADGIKTRAAELLGLSFRSFRYRLAKQGLSEKDEIESKGGLAGRRAS